MKAAARLLLFRYAFLLFLFVVHPARANDAVALELDRPATVTPRAATGLITSIAAAGTRLVAVGERGRILISDNDGVNWRQVESPTSVTLTRVVFADAQDGWTMGQMGVVLFTADAGRTWRRQLDGDQANAIMLRAAQSRAAKNPSGWYTAFHHWSQK